MDTTLFNQFESIEDAIKSLRNSLNDYTQFTLKPEITIGENHIQLLLFDAKVTSTYVLNSQSVFCRDTDITISYYFDRCCITIFKKHGNILASQTFE